MKVFNASQLHPTSKVVSLKAYEHLKRENEQLKKRVAELEKKGQ